MQQRNLRIASTITAHRHKRGSLRRTLLIAFLLLTFPTLVAISAITISRQYQSSRQQTIEQLTSVSTLKEAEITTWFDSLAPDLELVVANPRVRSDITQLVTTQHNEFVSNAWRGVLLDTFTVALIAGHKFEEVFLMDANGTVIVSTNQYRESQSFESQLFFKQGLSAPNVQIQTSFPSLSAKIVIVAAVPVRDEKNIVQGVLTGVANLDALNRIMQERAGLGRTGETYLVNSDHTMLTLPRDTRVEGFQQVHTQGSSLALSGLNGSGLYENYQSPKVPVVGVYRWIPEPQVALLAEQSQAEAFEETTWGIWTLLGVTIVVAVLNIVAAIVVSRSIAGPLEDLTSLATHIAGGDLTQTVQIKRADEIGTLANVFNTMTTRLRDLVANLEERVAARTAELQKRSQHMQTASEISQAASSTLDLATLLQESVSLIRDRFNFYYVGLFLLDEQRGYAWLRAGSDTVGSQMLAQQFKLPVDDASMIGWCIRHAQPRVALDVRKEAIYSSHPLLPNTRSEIDLPLITRGAVIGALDVESTEVNAFGPSDLTVLQTMAGQLANAIGNARLYASIQNELSERKRAEDALEKARNDLAALYQVTAIASHALDITTMLTKSLARTVEALYSNGGVIFLLDENPGSAESPALRLVAHQGIPPRVVERMNLSSEYGSAMKWVIEHQQPLAIPDFATDARASEPVPPRGNLAIVFAPMRAEGQVWGVLGLTRSSGSTYRVDETALLASIADQVGVAVRSDRLRERAQDATVLEERHRLARDLHDSATQALYSITLFAEAAKDSALSASQRQHHLSRLSETALQALKEMRLMIYELRPAALEQEGLVGALRRRLENVEHRAGVEAHLEVEPMLDLPIEVEGELYRIAQEALNNILKHSVATRVTVRLNVQGQDLYLEIEDNGRGFDAALVDEKAGIGLSSMRERAARLGGTLQIDSSPGKGTGVRFCVPLTHEKTHTLVRERWT